MRPCQICHSDTRKLIMSGYDREDMDLFECLRCGHRYVDAEFLTQEWFNNYYLNEYTTTDTPYSTARYTSLAAFVKAHASEVLDIGGRNGELHEYFDGFPYLAIGVGEEAEQPYEAVLLSHTLEHVYDIGAMFERVRRSLKLNGLLVVEVPYQIKRGVDPKKSDYHFQHINKFYAVDLERLFADNGFAVFVSERIEDYREYKCYRIAGRKL